MHNRIAFFTAILTLSTLTHADPPPPGYPNPTKMLVEAWGWHGDTVIQCNWYNDLWWGWNTLGFPYDDNVQLTLQPIADSYPPQVTIHMFEEDSHTGDVYSWPGIGTWKGGEWHIVPTDGIDFPVRDVPEPGGLAILVCIPLLRRYHSTA